MQISHERQKPYGTRHIVGPSAPAGTAGQCSEQCGSVPLERAGPIAACLAARSVWPLSTLPSSRAPKGREGREVALDSGRFRFNPEGKGARGPSGTVGLCRRAVGQLLLTMWQGQVPET